MRPVLAYGSYQVHPDVSHAVVWVIIGVVFGAIVAAAVIDYVRRQR